VSPASPVIPGSDYPEVVFAKDQPPYKPLPLILSDNGVALSRWRMSWKERLQVLLHGNIWVKVIHGGVIQPIKLLTEAPQNIGE